MGKFNVMESSMVPGLLYLRRDLAHLQDSVLIDLIDESCERFKSSLSSIFDRCKALDLYQYRITTRGAYELIRLISDFLQSYEVKCIHSFRLTHGTYMLRRDMRLLKLCFVDDRIEFLDLLPNDRTSLCMSVALAEYETWVPLIPWFFGLLSNGNDYSEVEAQCCETSEDSEFTCMVQ